MLSNDYLLDVDIKKGTAVFTPIFRRGDTAVLKFRVHDNSVNNTIKKFDRAEITIVMPSGIYLKENCQKENIQGVDIAKFQFQKIHSIEVGIYQVYLTIITGDERVSIPPVAIELTDNVSDADYEFEDIIRDMQKELDEIKVQVNKGIPIDSINKPNGVAGLDKNKKLLLSTLPDYFDIHMATSMYKDGAHGFIIDENGNPKVMINGNWEDAFFSEYPMGGGSNHEPPKVDIDNGNVTVTFPEDIVVALKKWDKGIRDIAWFKTNGNVFTTNEFTVSEIGDYTLYYQLTNGKEFVVVFQVKEEDLKPSTTTPIKDIPNGSIVDFGNTEWIILDNTKGMLITKGFVTDRQFDLATGTGIFNPLDENSIGYWLNNEFVKRFNSAENSMILNHIWDIGNELQEDSASVSTKVGLISFSQVAVYKDILEKFPLADIFNMHVQGFTTLSGDSSDNNNVWVANDSLGSISMESVAKNLPTKIRPVIFLDENAKLEIITEDELIPLSQFNDGDIVKFSNMKWKIIDKAKRLLLYHDDTIKRSFSDLRKWLQADFFYSLTTQAQTFVQNTEYNMQVNNAEGTPISDRKEFAYITLPSVEMWDKYKSTTMNHLDQTNFFFSSLYVNGFANNDLYSVVINPNVWDEVEDYFRSGVNTYETVLPVITLTENATVGPYDIKTTAIEDCQLGEKIHYSGYTWRYAGDNYLILESRFRHDQYNQIDIFTDTISDKGFVYSSDSSKNIGNRANMSFYLNYLYKKDTENMQAMTLETGLVGDEGSRVGSFKVGLIPNNEWTEKFSFTLFQYLGLEEDFWLLNWRDENTAQYVEALTGKILNANPTTTKKLFKPMIKLPNGANVTTYSIKDSIYAHIPDPIVRRVLNKLLGKGDVETQITIEEMKTITFFDSLDLMKAHDLTGVELLVNCDTIRAAHSTTFNITDFSPLAKLGKNPKVTYFSVYGVPEGDPSLEVYNQLKGQFPYLLEGGVHTNAHEKKLITVAELRGIPNGIYIRPEDEKFAYSINSDSVHDGYFYYSKIYAWGAEPLTHIKGFLEDDYIELEYPTYYYGTMGSGRFDMPSLVDGTDNTLYEAWFKNSAGEELKVFIQFTSEWAIYWNSKDMKPHIVITREKTSTSENVVLPNTINGIPMYSFGHVGGGIASSQTTIKNLTIPSNYKEIWDVFAYCYSLNNVYFSNPQIKFNDKYRAFMKPSPSTTPVVDVTFHAPQNSTVYDFYQYKISDENPQGASIKQYYKFKATQ